MCHTSVNFTPVFPWQQMGGKFSHRLVSTLLYLLYTHLCQDFFECEQLQVISCNLFKSTEFEILTLLNFEFPNKVEIHCSSLPPQGTAASSLSQQMATSLSRWMAGILPLSMNSQILPLSSLSHAGILPLLTNGLVLPLSMNGCHPSPFSEQLPSTFDNSLLLPLADGLPCLNKQLPPSCDEQLPPPSTNSSFSWQMASPLLQQTVSPFPQWTASSLPWWIVSSLNKCSHPVFQVDWLWVNTAVIVRVIEYTPSYYT